jgi:NADH:ubiquinone oxidoreductase subunit C
MLLQKIKSLLPTIFLSNQLLLITVNHFLVILNFLKNNIHYQFNSLQTIVGIDYINTTFRFALVYQLYSYTNKQYLNLKIFIPLKQKMESLTPIFINAN